MTTTADTVIGERINAIMFRQRMTKKALAEVLHTSDASVGRKIHGTSSFTIDELIVVARTLGVELADVLPGNDYDPVLSGRGRKRSVRHVGLEPTTRWFVVACTTYRRIARLWRRLLWRLGFCSCPGWMLEHGVMSPYCDKHQDEIAALFGSWERVAA